MNAITHIAFVRPKNKSEVGRAAEVILKEVSKD